MLYRLSAGAGHKCAAAAAAARRPTFMLLTVTKNMSSIKNNVFCEYMNIIYDGIALFVSAVFILVIGLIYSSYLFLSLSFPANLARLSNCRSLT